jgi:hypothetical protein
MDLVKQLEDKKKGCGEKRFNSYHDCGEYDCDAQCYFYCNECKEIIAILEQAIAEIEKRDEEVDNAIDFLSSYPIWTKIYHKEDGDTEEIPDELYPILDNFLVMIKKVLKQQLNQPKEVKDGS